MTHEFGGPWTERKLDCLRDYIKAWLDVMSKQPFERYYIDAFSGTGERHQRGLTGDDALPIGEIRDAKKFFDGSARIAMSFSPGFHRHILIEQHSGRFKELQKLQDDFPDKKIEFLNEDANQAVRDLCSRLHRRSGKRTVLFLDPYGCQVEWSTIEAIAATGAIDLWYLFPTGSVLRLLPHDHTRQHPDWAAKLTALLGTDEWREKFYPQDDHPTLFDVGTRIRRTATVEAVEQFVISRLKTVFPAVAKSCMRLENHQGFPNFSLCFAAGAELERGGGIALNISEHLIGKGRRRSKKR